MQIDERLRKEIKNQPYPLVFATISGAHLYGFPSPDSDFDLRGCHILPQDEVLGLNQPQETIEMSEMHEELQIDLVTHDIKKFFKLLLKKNGYVLEQLLSPLIVSTSTAHTELQHITKNCITKHHAHHYLGFSATQWKLLEKERPRRIKPLLYVYRVLFTGIHLMRTGEIEANINTLHPQFRVSGLSDLIEAKKTGTEQMTLSERDFSYHHQQYKQLRGILEDEFQHSTLPELPTAQPALHDLLIRLRLKMI